MITPSTAMLLGLGCILGVAGGIFQLGWPLVKKLADVVEAANKNRRRTSAAHKGVAVDVGHKIAAAKRVGLAPTAAILFPSRPSTRDSVGPGASPSQHTLRDPQSKPTSLHRSPHARPASPRWSD